MDANEVLLQQHSSLSQNYAKVPSIVLNLADDFSHADFCQQGKKSKSMHIYGQYIDNIISVCIAVLQTMLLLAASRPDLAAHISKLNLRLNRYPNHSAIICELGTICFNLIMEDV